MILLCGGEGAAGVNAGGAFFLLVSFAGADGCGGHRGVADAARARAAEAMPQDAEGSSAGRRRSGRGFLRSV
jgi:hypothetical protein